MRDQTDLLKKSFIETDKWLLKYPIQEKSLLLETIFIQTFLNDTQILNWK